MRRKCIKLSERINPPSLVLIIRCSSLSESRSRDMVSMCLYSSLRVYFSHMMILAWIRPCLS